MRKILFALLLIFNWHNTSFSAEKIVSPYLVLLEDGQCSGFNVELDHKVYGVTAAHCCGEVKEVFIVRDIQRYVSAVIVSDSIHDVCLIDPPVDFPSYSIGGSYEYGHPTTLVGFPHGLYSYIAGIAGIAYIKMGLVSISGTGIFSGISGGAVLDKSNGVVGVVTRACTDGSCGSFVPITYVKALIRSVSK